MHKNSGSLLFFEIKIGLIVAIPTFEGVIFLKPGPFSSGQVQPVFSKLFRGIDNPGNFTPDFLARLNLAYDFVRPFVRDMAIRTSRPHA